MEQEPRRCSCPEDAKHGAMWTGGQWFLWEGSSPEAKHAGWVMVPDLTICPWCKRVLLPGGETSAPPQWEAAIEKSERRFNRKTWPDLTADQTTAIDNLCRDDGFRFDRVAAYLHRITCEVIREDAQRLQEEADGAA